jgi:hypothetical protein
MKVISSGNKYGSCRKYCGTNYPVRATGVSAPILSEGENHSTDRSLDELAGVESALEHTPCTPVIQLYRACKAWLRGVLSRCQRVHSNVPSIGQYHGWVGLEDEAVPVNVITAVAAKSDERRQA